MKRLTIKKRDAERMTFEQIVAAKEIMKDMLEQHEDAKFIIDMLRGSYDVLFLVRVLEHKKYIMTYKVYEDGRREAIA